MPLSRRGFIASSAAAAAALTALSNTKPDPRVPIINEEERVLFLGDELPEWVRDPKQHFAFTTTRPIIDIDALNREYLKNRDNPKIQSYLKGSY